ncbi:hypothetical protein AB0C27_50855 [Nonomuraea sp. NPDC048882]|uniref:hypothetical protein n=1 Tax=Nonomuraea sp. NPDC048882 TaxID=3154347 RepID=UPI0033FBEB67
MAPRIRIRKAIVMPSKSGAQAPLQELTIANASLKTAIEELVRSKALLEAKSIKQAQTVKFLQATLALTLGICSGLGLGCIVNLAGASIQASLTAGTGAFFGVVTIAMAIIVFLNSGR